MYHYQKLFFLLSFSALLSCSTNSEIVPIEKIEIKKIEGVLILGNSLTVTTPSPELGWPGDWGMAASEAKNDYVHLLKTELEKHKENIEINYLSISNFEREFWSLDLTTFEYLKDYNPSLIIINIGENVNEGDAKNFGFGVHLERLIDKIKGDQTYAIVCIDSFWNKSNVNNQIKQICNANNYTYVSIGDLSNDISNMAIGEFSDLGVASHPSDTGMRKIFDRIIRVFDL